MRTEIIPRGLAEVLVTIRDIIRILPSDPSGPIPPTTPRYNLRGKTPVVGAAILKIDIREVAGVGQGAAADRVDAPTLVAGMAVAALVVEHGISAISVSVV
jgi:hypothetical protein